MQAPAVDLASTTLSPERFARFFSWLGTLLGCSSLLALLLFILAIFIIVVATNDPSSLPASLDFIGGLVTNLGVLGFAVALAALLSKHRPKALSILGPVAGALTLVIQMAFYFSY